LGAPFFAYWPGYQWNWIWWPSCDAFWGWGFGCTAYPYYGYGAGSDVIPQTYESPEYAYSGAGRELPQLYMKDGTMREVTDYWLMNGQIHFTTVEEGGSKTVEHVVGFDELDLENTIDVSTRRGFRVVLRNQPAEQYLREHENPAPGEPPPNN